MTPCKGILAEVDLTASVSCYVRVFTHYMTQIPIPTKKLVSAQPGQPPKAPRRAQLHPPSTWKPANFLSSNVCHMSFSRIGRGSTTKPCRFGYFLGSRKGKSLNVQKGSVQNNPTVVCSVVHASQIRKPAPPTALVLVNLR